MGYIEQRLPLEFLQILIFIGLTTWIYSAYSDSCKYIKINDLKKINRSIIKLRIALLSLIIFSTVAIYKNYDANPAKKELNKALSGKINYININNSKLANPEPILLSLKQMCNLPAHHSHTINNLQLRIYTELKTYLLELRRDSVILDEYWVYFPEYSRGVIGFICTDSLNDY